MCAHSNRKSSAPAVRLCRLLLGVCGILLIPVTALADANHYVNFLVGDRAAGMAGAYTGVADDPTGLYYNPAGTVYAPSTGLSASMNAYRATNTTYEGAIGGKDWERDSSDLVPNFFGVVHPMGPVVLGFSYAVPDSTNTDQDQEFTNLAAPYDSIDRYRINLNEFGSTYNFGPSLAFRLGQRSSLGLTLYGHYRSFDRIFAIYAERNDGETFWNSQRVETDEWGVQPRLGLMAEISDRVSLGLSASRTYVLSADSRIQSTTKDYGASSMVPTVADSSERRRYPYRLAAGLAWFATDAILLAADFSYHTAVTDDTFGDREATWNAALGAEWFLNRNWALRGGYFTDRANTPEVSNSAAPQNDHIDLHGVALSVSHHRRGTSLSLGAIYQRGRGETQLLAGSSDPQDAAAESLTIYLSSSYRN